MTLKTEELLAKLQELFLTPTMIEKWGNVTDNKFHFSDILDGLALVKEAVLQVEKIAHELEMTGAGSDKLDAVVKFLDGVVDLPFYLEMVDGPIIKVIVNATVAWYNKSIGHNWIIKVMEFVF